MHMAKMTQWESPIYDRYYYFSHEFKKGKHILVANGVTIEMKNKFMNSFLGFDEPIQLDGIEARFVFEKNEPDIAINGVFMRSGKNYVKRPAWVLVFAILCALIPIISLGGAIPVLFGLGGISLCVITSKSSLPSAIRVILCTVITLAAWILTFVIAIGINQLI